MPSSERQTHAEQVKYETKRQSTEKMYSTMSLALLAFGGTITFILFVFGLMFGTPLIAVIAIAIGALTVYGFITVRKRMKIALEKLDSSYINKE